MKFCLSDEIGNISVDNTTLAKSFMRTTVYKEVMRINKTFIAKLREEFKFVEESADFDSYDLIAEEKNEEWISGFRRAMLLVNNCIDIYKFHSDELAGSKLIK